MKLNDPQNHAIQEVYRDKLNTREWGKSNVGGTKLASIQPLTAFEQGLVTNFVGVAESCALAMWRKASHELDRDELISIAYLGLVQAAGRWLEYCEEKSYDNTRMDYFRAFVQRRCNGAIVDYLRSNDWAKRALRDTYQQIEASRERLTVGSETVSDEALAEHTGIPLQKIRDTKAALSKQPVSLDSQVYDVALKGDVESTAFEAEMREAVVRCLIGMSELARVVMVLHYYMDMELQQVASVVGIAESKASHIHTTAVLEVHEALTQVATSDGRV